MRAQPWGRARAAPASPSALSCARTVPPTCGWERVPYIHKWCVPLKGSMVLGVRRRLLSITYCGMFWIKAR